MNGQTANRKWIPVASTVNPAAPATPVNALRTHEDWPLAHAMPRSPPPSPAAQLSAVLRGDVSCPLPDPDAAASAEASLNLKEQEGSCYRPDRLDRTIDRS